MDHLTSSEELFLRYCDENGIDVQRVPAGDEPTPDFLLGIGGVEVACEVKQIEPNDVDKQILEPPEDDARASGILVPNRFRNKLKNISRQLRRASLQGRPTLLVIVDITDLKLHAVHRNVIEAMFGEESVRITRFRDGSTNVSRPYFGGNRRMTPDHNTSVSVVAVLEEVARSRLRLRTYHNRFARCPLSPTVFAGLPVERRLQPDQTKVRL